MDFLKRWLRDAAQSGTYRQLTTVTRQVGQPLVLAADNKQDLLDFSSNDYLALSHHPALISAAQEASAKYGAGSGSARLMSGDLDLFHHLETEIALLKGHEAALLFGSGYLANVGVIPTLVGRGDVIFNDRLNHASIYDGCRLSGAGLARFRHNDIDHLHQLLKQKRGSGRALIIVESVYSMDGDICPLADIISLKNDYSCLLMVDEAHATGVFGDNGGGIICRDGFAGEVDLAMGTFGKALGSYGAYISGTKVMKEYLVNRARSFIFTTALPPAVVAASLAAIKLVKSTPRLRQELAENVRYFKETLRLNGVKGHFGPSQIVPLLVGENHKALALADACRSQGVFATAVRPPTVPVGEARLRFSVTLHHSREALARAAKQIVDSSRKLSVPISF